MTADYQVLLDLDGVLIDMAPFAYELDGPKFGKWGRFFAHTPEAQPVPEGLALVRALHRLGWCYSISTTRPEHMGRRPCKRVIRAWCNAHLADWPPVGVYMRKDDEGAVSAADIMRSHFFKTAKPTHDRGTAVLFVDDEPEVVETLTANGIPALHLHDLAGLGDGELADTLTYCVGRAVKAHRAS